MSKDNSSQPDDGTITLARETLTGDIRDFLLDRLKHDKSTLPWNLLSEDKQRDVIQQTTDAARALVDKAVRIIAADGRSVMVGDVESVTVKDGVKAVIKLSKADPLRHALMDSQGMAVLIVVAAADPYAGERKPQHPEPDQKSLVE
jgi:hydrogenase maturation factor